MNGKTVLLGTLARTAIESACPEWVAERGAASPDAEFSRRLVAVEPGAKVTIFLGTWCGDSRRQLARLWRALDEAGRDPSFSIDYVGVDEAKREPAERIIGRDLRYVPTFLVERDGVEVGRIVEVAPNGIERDLLALLEGSVQGLLTTRAELLPLRKSATP